MKALVIILLFFFSACNNGIEKVARSAAVDYCQCIQKNVFRFKTKAEIYTLCNTELGKKYRLLELKYRIQAGEIDRNSLRQITIDSINQFMNVFVESIDSCAHLPN